MSAVFAERESQTEPQWEWVEYWLSVWTKFEMGDDIDLGLPSQAVGVLPGGFWGYRDPLGEWEAEGEHEAVKMINAELNDMPVAESAAVKHVRLGTPYPHERLARNYLSAKMKIGIRLRRGGFS
jgi:hypothetical protein